MLVFYISVMNMNKKTILQNKRDEHWNSSQINTLDGELLFHMAATDRDIKKISNKILLYSYYRFLLEEKLLRWVMKNKIKESNNIALDVGSGTGRFSIVFSDYFKQVEAFDLSKVFISSCIQRYSHKKNISFSVSNFQDFFKNNNKKYDFIFVGGVFMCMSDDEVKEGLNFISNHLSPDGVLFIRDTFSHSDKNIYVNNLKVYRTQALHESFFTLFEKKAVYNGVSRNYFCTAYRFLPNFLQESNFVFVLNKFLIRSFIFIDLLHVLIRGSKRHKLSNQLNYVYDKKI